MLSSLFLWKLSWLWRRSLSSQWSRCWSLSLLCRLLLSLLWCFRSTFDLYSCSSRGHHLY
jgi:hypothetical protein